MRNENKTIHSIVKVLWILTGIASVVVLVLNFVRLKNYDEERRAAMETASARPDADYEYAGDTGDGPGESDAEQGGQGTAKPSPTPSVTPEPTEEPTEEPTPTPEPERVVDPDKKMIAMTFDDGPSETATRRILDALTKHGARATFFMVGENVDRLPDIVKEVYEAGMEIANHTNKHVKLTEADDDTVKEEVAGNEKRINEVVPVGDLLLRPPYGSYNDHLKAIVKAPMICWSIDSLDWKTRDCDSVVEEVMANAADGYIILMHDLYKSTAEAVEILVPKLMDEGYQIVTVSELFEARQEELKDGHVYRMSTPAPTPTP